MSQAVITLLKGIWKQLGGDGGGPLPVSVDIESVTATDVTIHDATTAENKLKVNADGSTNTVTTLSGSKGLEAFQYQHTATIEPSTTVVVMDVATPVVIDFIDWVARNEGFAGIEIDIYGIGNKFIDTLGTGTLFRITPQNIKDGVSLIWDIVKYDTTVEPSPVFRFNLKSPLYCPNGLKITLHNFQSSLSFRNSVDIRGRKVT